ncbi:MAG TPA: hypothetical protein VKJ07_22950, partial [Mycobacteriales bacterium]|nr:hypothetical protein [Mycobacteriales bacterium]
ASSSPTDPNTANNSASAKTTVVWQAALDVGPFGVPSSTAPGAVVEVGEFYGNRGPSPAIDFKLTISLPPGTIYDHYSADPATLKCTGPAKGGQGDLVCTTPIVFVGSFYSVTAVVRVDPAAASGTVLTFPASVAASNASSQTSSASLTVLPSADLRVEVSAPSSVVGGNQFLNTITVTNDGPAAAIDAEVHYVQPGGPNSYEPMTAPPGWVCNQAICTNSSFAPGTATFTIAVPIPLALKSGTITGEVLVLSANDPTSANNTAFAATTIIAAPQATLQLSMTATPDVVNSGDQLTYTARIANTSNADAQAVNLHWMLPATLVATTCGMLSSPGCSFPTIAAGTTQTATWTVRVAAGAGTLLTARTTIDGPNIVYDPQLLSATLTTTVAGTPHVDLEAAISTPQAVRPGETAAWIYSVQNHGPDPATDWQLTLPLPPNTYLTAGSVKWGTGTCSGLTPNAANAQVTCHGTYLAANSDFDLQLLLTVIPGTTAPIHATATVSTANVDTDSRNDTTVAATTILTSAAITESITPDKTAAVMGERVKQTITLTGHGPDAATG